MSLCWRLCLPCSADEKASLTSLMTFLNGWLDLFDQHCVILRVQEQVIVQLFSYYSIRLFNTIMQVDAAPPSALTCLQRKALVTCGNGVMIKMGLTELESWIANSNRPALT